MSAPASPILPSPCPQPAELVQVEPPTNPVQVTPATKAQEVVDDNYDMSQFRLDQVLSNATNRKMIACLGRFVDRSDTDRAIVLLEKNPFDECQFSRKKKRANEGNGDGLEEVVGAKHATADGEEEDGYFSSASKLEKRFTNDIYGTFECYPNPAINSVKTTIIYPATENHIKKHSSQDIFIFNETPEDYRTKTLPHLESEQFSLDWVYNILEHRKETEHIVFEDTCPDNGFVLLPDLKWDGKTIDALYLQAIVHRRNIKSIRDLTGADLPLLYNVRRKGIDAITAKYGIPGTQLRIYFHYQPSFYHLHIHFTYLKHEAPGIRCERGHILDTVITNLELMSDYYKRVTLPFVVSRQFKLYAVYAGEKKPEEKPVCEATKSE